MNTWKVNNFNDSLIIGRVVPSPSFIKILLSEYGVVALYDKKKQFKYLSWLNSIITLMTILPLILISSIFLAEFINLNNINTNQSISSIVIFSFIIFHSLLNLLFYCIGFIKKNSILIEKKLNFDSLIANILIRIVTTTIIFLFTLPSFIIDPLLPITITELKNASFLLQIIYLVLGLLIFISCFHLILIILVQILKIKIINIRIKDLMIEATSTNDTTLSMKLNKLNVNKIIFQKRVKK